MLPIVPVADFEAPYFFSPHIELLFYVKKKSAKDPLFRNCFIANYFINLNAQCAHVKVYVKSKLGTQRSQFREGNL